MKINKYKITLLMICVMLMSSAVFRGTVAYLTDQEKVLNTFTVGQVQITLDEAEVTPDGQPVVPENRVTENEYHLIPGVRYTKDPTVTVGEGSEKSYIRMILTVYNRSAVDEIIADPKNGLTDYADLLDGWDKETWIYNGFTVNEPENAISFEFRYKEPVSGFVTDDATGEVVKGEVKLDALFDGITVPSTLNGEELRKLYDGNFRMVIEGHAIQATGFADETGIVDGNTEPTVIKTAEDIAWEAFGVQKAAEDAANQPGTVDLTQGDDIVIE